MPSRPLLLLGLAVAFLGAGCAARTRGSSDDLGAKDAAIPDSLANYSVPLDLTEFDIDTTTGGARGVFLKFSRLPSGVSATAQSSPAQIILDVQGPTGGESPEELFPGGDSLVTRVGVSRHVGGLRIVLHLASDELPEYSVYPMADWVMVRIRPLHPRTVPWAHQS